MSFPPLRRLLIANRGEIVVRIARTARRLGIGTVGVYSDADADASFLGAVDVAVALGGSSPAESYLRGDAIVDAARRTGADAIHPGYGFLAENAAFARAVIDAGLLWVGPTPDQIATLGDKLTAKRAAIEAGVSTLEGETFPVMIKAAAGGGGRGMRIVHDAAGLDEAIAAASREAESAFGDGTVFVEPYIERARHVEVQIVGDKHGSVVHFGERECSIQRRNQKVLEEAPSPGIDATTRSALHDGALALAKHVGYENAGTVEFLVGDDGAVQFLEVNTRLQVEHPVTEAVTGIDLVELQLRVAVGEPLPVTQDDITVDGHAIEARLVAEDPAASWLPSVGAMHRLAIADTVRVDAGFDAGDTVTPEYDSLLAKVIAHAPSRTEAAATLRRALQHAQIHGPTTNRDALVAILGETDFLGGATFTRYLDDHAHVLTPPVDDHVAITHVVAAVFAAEAERRTSDDRWNFVPSGWRNVRTQGQRGQWRLDRRDAAVELEYAIAPDGRHADVVIDGTTHSVRRSRLAGDRWAIELDGVRRIIAVNQVGSTMWTNGGGEQHVVEPLPRFTDHTADATGSGPVAPLPGTIIAVAVEPGDEVDEGTVLVVLEAMKMEHRITTPGSARVTAVDVAVGDRVEAGQILVHLEHTDGG